MSTKRKRKGIAHQNSEFKKQVERALKHFDDPAWLGRHSPLAAPYLEYLQERAIDVSVPIERGKALQELLREAVNQLREQDARSADLLELTYFRRRKGWKVERIADEIYTSKAQYYQIRNKRALPQLSEILVKRLKPALRLESPTPVGALIGRDEVIDVCTMNLKEGKAVGLSGPGGIGKTALGVYITAQLQPVFWYTFRLGLNDHLPSLLFELAHFLSHRGSSYLWAQLVADSKPGNRKALSTDMLLGLLRYDLERLATTPVLCFDEVDLLQSAELEAHAILLTFLESLKRLTPCLFIGQHLPLEVAQRHHLKGLRLDNIQVMLKQADIQLSQAAYEQLNTYTQGNPRLLELFIALHRTGEELNQLLAALQNVPSLEFLLRRISLRLSECEREMLASLVPFRRPAPLDAWRGKGEQEALNKLLERHLVQTPHQGEVTLLPAFRNILYKQLPTEVRRTVYLQAAKVREVRAEYTAAAHHYLQAGEVQIAFRLWHTHQEEEINQGQAENALRLFEEIADDQLSQAAQEELALLQAQLLKISGQYDRSYKGLLSKTWQIPALKAQAKRLEGDLTELRDNLETAMNAYRAGLHTVEKFLSEKAHFHKNLGWVARRQNRVDEAWRQALLADYEAENLKGYVQESMGDFDEARAYYLQALGLAEEAKYEYGCATTYNNLGRLLTAQREFDLAEMYFKSALDYFKRRGQLNNIASVRVNQALLSNLSGQYQATITPAKEALEIFERLGEPWGQTLARICLGEAYLAVRDLANAEGIVQQIIRKVEGRLAYDAWWTLGEVRLAQKRYEEAKACLERVINFGQQEELPVLEGYAWRSLGKVYGAQGEEPSAKAAFERAISLFTEIERFDQVKETREAMREYGAE